MEPLDIMLVSYLWIISGFAPKKHVFRPTNKFPLHLQKNYNHISLLKFHRDLPFWNSSMIGQFEGGRKIGNTDTHID